jgi:hypothetical protein
MPPAAFDQPREALVERRQSRAPGPLLHQLGLRVDGDQSGLEDDLGAATARFCAGAAAIVDQDARMVREDGEEVAAVLQAEPWRPPNAG